MKSHLIKLLCVITALCAVLSLSACSSGEQPAETTGEPTEQTASTEATTGPSEGSDASTQTVVPSTDTPAQTTSAAPEPTATPSPATPTPTEPPTPTPTLTPYTDEDFDRIPTGGRTVTLSFADMRKGDLLLISSKYGYDPALATVVNAFERIHDGDAPSTGYLRFMNNGILASAELVDAFARMQHAMKIETGTTKDLVIRACYMTSSEIDEKKEDTRFGFCIGDDPLGSEHGAGIGANIAFVDSAGLTYRLGDGGAIYESNWIVNNAHRFGLIQRYTKVKSGITGHAEETAHFRYVGIAHATYMKEHNLCLEEYFALLDKHDLHDPIVVTDPYGYSWTVYCEKAIPKSDTSFLVPDGLVCSISGNNYSGFIVTVKGTFDPAIFDENYQPPDTTTQEPTVVPIDI